MSRSHASGSPGPVDRPTWLAERPAAVRAEYDLAIVAEAFDAEDGWGYRRFLVHDRR